MYPILFETQVLNNNFRAFGPLQAAVLHGKRWHLFTRGCMQSSVIKIFYCFKFDISTRFCFQTIYWYQLNIQ